ncbi:MAG TPA: hypothetical protein VIX20_05790, partial [Ktedonobacteraceae bacterium]
TLLLMLVILLAVLPITINSSSQVPLRIIISALIASFLLLFLNRLGFVLMASILAIVVIDAAFALTVLTAPGGLGAYNVPIFDFLVISVIAAAFLLPPGSIFLVAVGNILFIWADLTFQPHSSELEHILTMSDFGYTIILRPIALHVVVAIVAFFWVRRALQATQRAQRAEVIAELEHALAEQGQIIADQKHQLDVGVQQLLQTHVQAANGNLSIRAPLTQNNVLWQVAVSLNTLLARLQRSNLTAREHYRLNAEIENLAEALRSAKRRRKPIEYSSKGTPLDTVLGELNGTYVIQASHPSMEKNLNIGVHQTVQRDFVRF